MGFKKVMMVETRNIYKEDDDPPALPPAGTCLTKNEKKEQYSFAFVKAVAAAAGLPVQQRYPDKGIDLVVEATGGDYIMGAQVRIQAKGTAQDVKGSTSIRFRLKKINYDILRKRHAGVAVLVVVYMPDEPGDWIDQDHDRLICKGSAYWLRLDGAADIGTADSITVEIPLAQVFSPAALNALMEEASERQ